MKGPAHGPWYAGQAENPGERGPDQLIQLRVGGVVVVSAAGRDGGAGVAELLPEVDPASEGDQRLAAFDVSMLNSSPDGALDGVRQQPGNAREQVAMDQQVHLVVAPPVPGAFDAHEVEDVLQTRLRPDDQVEPFEADGPDLGLSSQPPEPAGRRGLNHRRTLRMSDQGGHISVVQADISRFPFLEFDDSAGHSRFTDSSEALSSPRSVSLLSGSSEAVPPTAWKRCQTLSNRKGSDLSGSPKNMSSMRGSMR